MALYRYRAVALNGEQQQGQMQAQSAQEVITYLQERELMVLEVSDRAGWGAWRQLGQKPAMTTTELLRWTEQLATLLAAGQTLDKALTLLASQAQREPLQRLIERLRERVKGGMALSAALREEHGIFPALYISLVQAGEAGGQLDGCLLQLHGYLQRAAGLKAEVINALIYPCFLLVGVLGSLVLLLSYVVPQFVPIFADLGVPVPAITQAILLLGSGLSQYGLIMLMTLTIGLWWLALRYRQPATRLAWQAYWLRQRGIGPFLQRLHTARLARTLGTLLQSGVPLVKALQLSREVTGNLALQQAMSDATERVKNGALLSSALAEAQLLPVLAVQMMQVGEEAGQLDAMLLKVAVLFDTEVKHSIDRFMAALTPCLTIVMTLLVALIMLSIMLPLMNLTSGL
ncbi:type II secretion system F family protein [Pokkaliibacter sp. MBI-7]|uniref:type II secretion system F family protein n=1 Tax=Pokkaliibacter sp. MBI-7 TaxID=3040600 RepID=UPI0024468A50|nr:type II secretion system F family protein [Pokkaliibacter sp. MBI-7]MDH2431076.1 type II secretion system F family protein [Pokkaliibacter sp. MBI-7]MDH2433001.1 type II secretion system F family protein [Pokkaliibacter sp. MBI-7]